MPLSKEGRYVYCIDCGCRLEMNGTCKICGHVDEPPEDPPPDPPE